MSSSDAATWAAASCALRGRTRCCGSDSYTSAGGHDKGGCCSSSLASCSQAGAVSCVGNMFCNDCRLGWASGSEPADEGAAPCGFHRSSGADCGSPEGCGCPTDCGWPAASPATASGFPAASPATHGARCWACCGLLLPRAADLHGSGIGAWLLVPTPAAHAAGFWSGSARNADGSHLSQPAGKKDAGGSGAAAAGPTQGAALPYEAPEAGAKACG